MLDDPAWKDDLPKMVVGSLARQRRGAWLTTTANLWGSLALDKFAAKFESQKVAGTTVAQIDLPAPVGAASSARVADWGTQPAGGRLALPWPPGSGTLTVAQQGSGKPWLTVQSLAAIPLKAPLAAGYSIARSISAVEQKDKARWSRGDIVRVRLEIDAQVMSAWVAFEERSFEAYRGYYEDLPRGKHVVEYSVRLNNPGKFALPPTRVEAMYAPESFGEAPNASIEVAP